jgi:hypothetical protein
MGYDPVEQEMIVTFKTGKTYRFREVPNQVYAGLLAAESPGRFVHQVLRTYGGEQVLAEEPEVKEEEVSDEKEVEERKEDDGL